MTTSGAPGFLAIALLMVAAGTGIPVMATLNAGLGQHIGSPVAAGAILCGIGFLVAGAIVLIAGVEAPGAFSGVPPYYYAAALAFVFYIIAITWAAPRIGIGNAVFFVLLGQLAAAAAIDHFGLFGAVRSAITGRRLIGMLVMALGVYFARKPQ